MKKLNITELVPANDILQEKGIDYDVCSMTPKGLVKILDTYLK